VWHKIPLGGLDSIYLHRTSKDFQELKFDVSIHFQVDAVSSFFSVAPALSSYEHWGILTLQNQPIHRFHLAQFDEKMFLESVQWVQKFAKMNSVCIACGKSRGPQEFEAGSEFCNLCI
jgi:hypothetical protein